MDGDSPQTAGAAMLDAANSDSGTTNTAPEITTPVADNSSPAAPVQAPSNSGHPAWNQYLKDIPEGFHPIVKPAFEQWDQEVQRRLAEVQSRYKPYEQYIGNTQPEQIGEALRLYQMMANDPQQIFNAMAEHYGFGQDNAGQGQAVDETDEFDLGAEDDELSQHPRFQQLLQQQEALQQQQAQFVQAMEQAQQARAAQEAEAEGEQWLEQKISATTELLKEKGIEPDWDYIFARTMALGQSNQGLDNDQAWEQSVNAWINKVNGMRPSASSGAPPVMPTSGGTPSNQIPNITDGKTRRELGAAYLQAAFRNG